MGKNKYVGHRYIPIFENGWDKTRTYEPLTFVYYEGKTYVSRQLVPTNVEITDNDFWAFFMDNTAQIFTPTFTGQWEDKEYEPLSIVVSSGNTYVSKQNVPLGTVLTDETYWLDLSTYYNQLFTEYETAEQERQQAEAIRIENENQRKTDHANRSAELASKADKVVLKNLIENGDFSNGLSEWVGPFNGSLIDGVVTGTHHSSAGLNFIYKTINPNNAITGEITYVVARLKNNGAIVIGQNSDANTIVAVNNDFTIVSNRATRNSAAGFTFFIRGNGVTISLDWAMDFNLTRIFGAGNEPTKEEMDELIKITGYINGEYALNNKEMLIWTLSLMRSNRNAIIALGGTI